MKIDTSADLSTLIQRVIDEGIKSALTQKALTEKEKQVAMATSPKDDENSGDNVGDLFGGAGDDEEDDDNEGAAPSKTMDDESEKLQKGDIEPKDIVDKLNAIRSGKSFKDSAVKGAMEEYISSLSKAERVALLAFTRGIAQIVTGEVPGNQAEDPHEKPADVKMQKGDGPEKVTRLKPNVIKVPGMEKKKDGSHEEEDTSAPITPKRKG